MLNHVAIILDGNGRWAKLQGKPRTFGHYEGMKNIKRIAVACKNYGVKALSVYCFSTENWNRPDDEVKYLMNLPGVFLESFSKDMDKDIKVIVSGRKDRIPSRTLKALNSIVEKTKDHKGMILNLCLDYGALNDIKTAILNMPNEIDENTIYDYLSSKDLGKVDLLIRPGGEKRLSNFMLLECAYAELYFSNKYWPEFNEADLIEAFKDFESRDRRFGSIKA